MRVTKRGMALVQALVIVAAIAAVSAALLLRAGTAQQRLQTRFQADQVALYLDSGVGLVASMLAAIPPAAPVHPGQDWARAREGVIVDRGTVAWQVEDLQGRFNINELAEDAPQPQAARDTFLRLAADHGLRRGAARRLADALIGEDPMVVIDPRQLASLVQDDAEDFAEFATVLTALPAGTAMNINTLQPTVLEALLPDLPSTARNALQRRIRQDPFPSRDALLTWATQALPPEFLPRFEAVTFTTTSAWFTVSLDAQLDTLRLRRSVVLTRDAEPEPYTIYLSMPEFE